MPRPAAPVRAEPTTPPASQAAPADTTRDTAQAAAPLPTADPLASEPRVEVAAIADIEVAVPRKIEIRANRRTWMRIEDSQGKVLFSSIIREDERFELAEEQIYTLATRDAGALEFMVNGDTVGAVGRRGQILTARQIDRDAILALKP